MRDAAGAILKWFGTCTDIDELKRAEAVLEQRVAERTTMLRAITDNSPDPIFLKDRDSRLLFANPAVLAAVHKTAAEVLGKTDEEFYDDPALGREKVINDRRVMESGQTQTMEETVPDPAGARTFLSVKTPYHDAAGNVIGVIGIARDITDRKQAEAQIKAALAEKEVLLREIHHRVKNNLQVISSLVSLQADTLDDDRLRAVFGDVRDRVRTMALVHEALYQTTDLAQLDFADYAARLMQHLWRAHRAPAGTVQLNLAVASVHLPVDTAVPCGLILNELASNAIKHAFPAGRSGTITVALDYAPATRAACLRVHDDGVGLPAGLDWRESSSLGLRLVQMLAGQLRGTAEPGPGPGTVFRVNFVLPHA